MNILEIVGNAPRMVANEALYYCLRALKQAGLPPESKKDYFYDTKTSAPSAEGIELAKLILEKICDSEHTELDHIARYKINEYLTNVAQASSAISARVEGFDVSRGAELLRHMRTF